MQTPFQKALAFAATKHTDQKVPGTELPYVCHLSNVAMEVFVAALNTNDFDVSLAVQVALLHDTLEDTATTFDELADIFGKEVADGVSALTKDKNLPKGQRMQDSLERVRKQTREIWAVKMADRITNLQPPPKHWNLEKKGDYLEEARVIHGSLKDGNKYLAEQLRLKIEEYGAYCKEYKYEVFEDDNFHWEDEGERDRIGTFFDREEALTFCRTRVDNSLRHHYRRGFTPERLYDYYLDFGSDPFIRTEDKDCVFSARMYAKERSPLICKEMEEQKFR